jgi:hypothetical protein
MEISEPPRSPAVRSTATSGENMVEVPGHVKLQALGSVCSNCIFVTLHEIAEAEISQ